jgi:signal transduction histidine kinase
VVNLISNAHHALSEKASDDRLFRVRVRNAGPADRPVVRVEFYDNGPGVPLEIRDRIFDPFFTTRRDSGGTGLGLSLSFGIVRDYGGRIWVESEVGRYTRFVVELPAESSREAEYAEGLAG